MKRLFKGEAYRPTGYGITFHPVTVVLNDNRKINGKIKPFVFLLFKNDYL
ncbi:MAG: hypothetical protein LBJ00_04680 [Planctomycetaceae bacterium]|nr:hypothetical protein [Planctomycetaceae bacterium]